MFKTADVDKDGVVDYDEFLHLWGSKVAKPRKSSTVHKMLYKQEA